MQLETKQHRQNRLRKLIRAAEALFAAQDEAYVETCEAIQTSICKDDFDLMQRLRQKGNVQYKRCDRTMRRIDRLKELEVLL